MLICTLGFKINKLRLDNFLNQSTAKEIRNSLHILKCVFYPEIMFLIKVDFQLHLGYFEIIFHIKDLYLKRETNCKD